MRYGLFLFLFLTGVTCVQAEVTIYVKSKDKQNVIASGMGLSSPDSIKLYRKDKVIVIIPIQQIEEIIFEHFELDKSKKPIGIYTKIKGTAKDYWEGVWLKEDQKKELIITKQIGVSTTIDFKNFAIPPKKKPTTSSQTDAIPQSFQKVTDIAQLESKLRNLHLQRAYLQKQLRATFPKPLIMPPIDKIPPKGSLVPIPHAQIQQAYKLLNDKITQTMIQLAYARACYEGVDSKTLFIPQGGSFRYISTYNVEPHVAQQRYARVLEGMRLRMTSDGKWQLNYEMLSHGGPVHVDWKLKIYYLNAFKRPQILTITVPTCEIKTQKDCEATARTQHGYHPQIRKDFAAIRDTGRLQREGSVVFGVGDIEIPTDTNN